jgi:single-strand DNA-binding protein
MSTTSTVKGNLLADPDLRTVTVQGQQKTICELRVMSDVWTGEGDARKQDPARTQPVQITVWGEALAKQCAAVLKKGMRILATGQSHIHFYRVSDADRAAGKNDSIEMRMSAEDVSLALNRIESIQMRKKDSQTRPDAGPGGAAPGGFDDMDDDIPF